MGCGGSVSAHSETPEDGKAASYAPPAQQPIAPMTLAKALEHQTSISELLSWSRDNVGKDKQAHTEHFLTSHFGSKGSIAEVAREADLNRDGVVTRDELEMKYSGLFDEETARLAQLAKAADLDGDGEVTSEELQKKYGNKTQAQKAQEELNALLAKRYIQLADEDNDGNITSEELMRIEQRVEEHMREEQRKEQERRRQEELSQIPVEDKAKLLQEHHEKITDMKETQQLERGRKEAELQQRLKSRRRRRTALKHMTTDSITKGQGDAAKMLLQNIIAEAEADGTVDQDEQKEIEQARDVLAKLMAT